ncbi:hypothetical protein FEZ18_03370 [Oceanihabitans sp. IOP_32]|uniref:bacteriocin immunity protein n=1 Tax=Oceanihabitans sp. IOP_32 TaxID=2529032 RepID=UPI0012937193|nr:bacteriocin immunity protein [Oceanihabitans sp. IOP_32]QFZ53917.1 hypothetical protein FEZ18_03370 [Oceanihabitans sp. IOP_32]
MTREELEILVKNIVEINGKSEKEIDGMIEKLKSNVPHPSVTDLIYYENLTPKEIVEKALSYKPIQL